MRCLSVLRAMCAKKLCVCERCVCVCLCLYIFEMVCTVLDTFGKEEEGFGWVTL